MVAKHRLDRETVKTTTGNTLASGVSAIFVLPRKLLALLSTTVVRSHRRNAAPVSLPKSDILSPHVHGLGSFPPEVGVFWANTDGREHSDGLLRSTGPLENAAPRKLAAPPEN